jgi:coiled-coil domain-containing protein 130
MSGNKLAGKHALGSRARKASSGILTVRFEMPFPIWCSMCPKPTIIGQGVRFNAEKKKVGNYHSTPVFSFRMKHVVCGGWIEIRTDPKNTAYVVTEGAKKKDLGEDKVLDGEEDILLPGERERLKEDAFAALEGKVVDGQRAKEQATRLEELKLVSERDWSDTYEVNRRIRRGFRAERKTREKEQGATEELKDRYGLGLELLPNREEDANRAKFVEFGSFDKDLAIQQAKAKPLFHAPDRIDKQRGQKGRRNPDPLAEARKKQETLQQQLQLNTRATVDPFLNRGRQLRSSEKGSSMRGVKRKQAMVSHSDDTWKLEGRGSTDDVEDSGDAPRASQEKPVGLVSYDSDD